MPKIKLAVTTSPRILKRYHIFQFSIKSLLISPSNPFINHSIKPNPFLRFINLEKPIVTKIKMDHVTPQTKHPQPVRQNATETSKNLENTNPNLTRKQTTSKPLNSSPGAKSGKTQKSSGGRNPSIVVRNKIRDRKFVVVAKKKKNQGVQGSQVVGLSDGDCKCKEKVNGKCICVAYKSLRASQEEFFKGENVGFGGIGGATGEIREGFDKRNGALGKEGEAGLVNGGNSDGYEGDSQGSGDLESVEMMGSGEYLPLGSDSPQGNGCSNVKRRRDKLLEEARESIPESGSGRVMYLVQTFERLLSLPRDSEAGDEKESKDVGKGMKWGLPGLQERPKAQETEESSSLFCPGNFSLTAESLGLESGASSSYESNRGSIGSRTSVGSHNSKRSCVSSGTTASRRWKNRHPKATSLQPFKLRTEQRGRMKEEEFLKKLEEMMIEEERKRIPIAQGLPWTTDEPECLIKPPVKESTRPIDLKLYTDVRAVERAEFDHLVNEKVMRIEEYKMERERQQKLAEEEEIRKLRKELVPKAQPMPYFDRPFIPRRSMKNPTIPKEPKFHLQEHKKIKCHLSMDDVNFKMYTHHQ
ncbi:hypothetical protein Droror1_Dr00024485 [Drosera rotundifolia]